MVHQKSLTARAVAAEVLNQFNPRRNYAGQILNKFLPRTNEKQRATDLVFGTIRNRIAIDAVITKFSGCPIEGISAKLLNIIRVAAFELIYSPMTPDYSIVNEAVENTKAIGGKKQTGFVNAVLRNITRRITDRQIQLSQANPKRTLPQTPAKGCQFDNDFLPEPQNNIVDYLSLCFSLPSWLIKNWLGEFGQQKTQDICFASNRRPSIYLRPNILKTTTQKLLKKLHTANIDAEVIPDLEMIKIESPKTVTELPGFEEGLFSVQDITAYQVIRILNPQPNWIILDLCAAPGTKTTQLAEQTGDKAEIVATDIDAERLKMLKENIVRLGIKSVKIIAYDSIRAEAERIGGFDAVLLDVPCSNTGVLARRVEIRYRLKPIAIKKLAKIQRKLLSTAAEIIKQGGKICYSTCSIGKTENSKLVRDFLSDNNNFELEYEKLTLPSAEGFDCDGGYVAVIKRSTPAGWPAG
jgi:16S rRNA (cytosine967-C5)-methyltransferase